MKERNFLMAGGGTGGHVIPGLAVARELKTRGHHVTFVGTEHGLEAKLVPAAGFDLQKIQIGGLNRVGLRQTFASLGRLPIATVSSDRCVRGASAVFSMGGYVAGPPVLAAIFRRIPVVVMEPNAVPGIHQPLHLAPGLPRAGLLSGDRRLLPQRPHRSHRTSRPRRVFSHPA